ncbi:TonB-dependent receptor [Acidiphilium sp.]|uniref:TonB-dependent receptor n=1 Tax=Acidiphilium sp. TaxID=527 RepID=UPI003D055CA0
MAHHAHARHHGKRTAFAVLLLSGTALAPVVARAQAVNAGTVSASGTAALPGATPAPTQKKIFKSGQTVRVLNKDLIDQAGPVGGAARALSYAPGVNINTYGNTGSTKATITLNGVTQGWGGYAGYTQDGAIAVTFDGVPIADAVTGLWQAPTIPQNGLIQNTNVIYGPGNPVDRWYNNIAGEFAFTPIQPTDKPGADLHLTYGSDQEENIDFDVRSGLYHGWSTVLAGGLGQGNSFRTASDGFQNPSRNYAFYGKTIKTFASGSFELGAYIAQSRGYRAQVIPFSPVAGVTTNGLANGPLYSQPTSGYYSTLPYSSYNKFDGNQLYMVYGRENIALDDTTTLHNLTYFTRIDRLHSRLNDVYNLGAQQDEHNNPYTYSFGDKLDATVKLPFNTVDVGGYYIYSQYNSRNNFYNPAAPYFGNPDVINAGGKTRSSYFDQNNFAAFIQDDINPISMLHITPGLRVEQFMVNYSPETLQDFTLAPGAAGNFKNQSGGPADHQTRTGLEPSIAANLQVLPWLALYGSYSEEWKSPELGGGGGFFQKVPGQDYQLELGQEFQAGFKAHIDHAGFLNRLLIGANYYHLRYAKQSIPITNAAGNTVIASGTSEYSGVNMFLDDNLLYNLHLTANANVESAKYTSYNVNGTDYSGSPVSYVPNLLLNLGAYYNIPVGEALVVPKAWFQYTGTQSIFDDITSAPSRQKMGGFGVFNLSVKYATPIKVPYAGTKKIDFTLTALNVLDRRYHSYSVISAGGYFGGTPGYLMGYPGAPLAVFGTVGIHF